MSDKKTLIPMLISAVLTALMVGAAELTGERELIFPEITAIAIGALAAPVQSWNADRKHIFALMMASAVTGMAVVHYIPLPTVLRIPIGLAAVMAMITVSHTNFLPAVSACVLPIMLGSCSPMYLVSVGLMTGLILISQLILEKTGLRAPHSFTPETVSAGTVRLRAMQALAASLLCAVPVMLGEPFFTAPPLIVAFCEFSSPNSKLWKNIQLAALIISLSAFMGCSSRLLLCELLGLPMALAAGLTCIAVLSAVKRSDLYFPPCGAVAALSFLIPADILLRYPFEITGGFLVFALVTLIGYKTYPDHEAVLHHS